MRFLFHPLAEKEYESAFEYYLEISPDVAKSFVELVESGIKKVCEFPKTWPVVEEDIHRFLLHRFPFGIYYSIEKNHILILAIMHMSRHPNYWKNRRSSKSVGS